MAHPPHVIRPLGTYEQYSSSRYHLGIDKNVITTARYALPTSITSESQVQASFERAIVAVVDKLPALRVGMVDEGTRKPLYVAVPSMDMANHVEWRTIDRDILDSGAEPEYDAWLMGVVEKEHERPWNPVATTPPWRIVGFPHVAGGWVDVSLEILHVLGDGMSTVIFHKTLVATLNKDAALGPTPTSASTVLACTEAPQLVPTQEELVKFTISWPFFAKTLWSNFGPRALQPAAPQYTGQPVSWAAHKGGRLHFFRVSEAATAALLAACRAHDSHGGVTLTALLHAVMMTLWARRLPADVAPTFKALTPVSLRRIAKKASPPIDMDVEKNLANLVSGHCYVMDPKMVASVRLQAPPDASSASLEETKNGDDTVIWKAAEVFSKDLKQSVARIQEDNVMGLMAWISDWHKWWAQQDNIPRDATWTVSNVGSVAESGLDQGSGGSSAGAASGAQWRLQRIFYSQTAQAVVPLLNLTVGGVRGHGLSFVIKRLDGVVEQSFADSFVADLHACLEGFGTTGKLVVPNRTE